MKKIKGIAASPGIVTGRAMLVNDYDEFSVGRQAIDKKDVAGEIIRLEDAIIRTRKQILRIQSEIAKEMGREHAEIFEAHLMVIEDRTLIEEIIRRVKKEHFKVEYIF